uniref:Uncharacterized protein n=1 Tax=Rhizophora mucronata TaxID=61149 RepID=A0A2P2NR98_RHIMU
MSKLLKSNIFWDSWMERWRMRSLALLPCDSCH